MTFAESLRVGQIGEGVIARWFRAKGYTVLPVYEVEKGRGKGPRLFAPERTIIAPDMLVYRDSQAYWIEAKHKTGLTLHRNTGIWTVGIDLPHYEDYCALADSTAWPVWLVFLLRGGQTKDSPPNSLSGLYGQDIRYLRQQEHHRHERGGPHGMVYWAISSFRRLATIAELENLFAENP